MNPAELRHGQVYFVLGFEDEALSRPIVQSHEYLGRSDPPMPERPLAQTIYFGLSDRKTNSNSPRINSTPFLICAALSKRLRSSL